MVFGLKKKSQGATANTAVDDNEVPVQGAPSTKSALIRVAATGAGLKFSDGYIANSISSVSEALKRQYGDAYTNSSAVNNLTSIAFVGIVVGQLSFGYLADHWGRVNSLLLATVIMIVFTALCAGAYYHGESQGTIKMLVAWRFFLGIGLGGEYLGSTGCAESTAELSSGQRNRWFILFTNTAIDWGFVFGAFVPYVVAAACGNAHYQTVWRTSIGIGIVWPLGLLFLRFFIREPEEFSKNSMAHVKRVPYLLFFKFYGFRLLIISIIWFLYDFSTYSFGLYANSILSSIYGDEEQPLLTTIYGWNTVINMFYLPGTILGAFVSDWIGPRYTLALGVTLQAIVGFGMAAGYDHLNDPSHLPAFAVVYGIFLALGELGPGNNIGLLASKTSATPLRGHYYGCSAAIGKLGAYITYVFPYIQAAGGSGTASAQYPFYVSSSLCILSAVLVLCFVPNIGQDTIQVEDARFRAYLESQGWDTSQLGLRKERTTDGVEGRRVESVGGGGPAEAAAEEEKKL